MRYTKYLALLAASFLMASCGDDFLDTELTGNASEEQIKDLLDKKPTAIQAYITGYYKNTFSPEAQQSHDDFGLKAFELATDLMGDDMAYKTAHFFVYDYMLDNRGATYRRTTTCWQELYAIISGANEVINGLASQAGDGDKDVEKMLGQSYTIRAYCYYWLINMYQQPYEWNKDKPGIPVYTESETRLNRVPVKEVYDQILSDLDKGYNFLKGKGISKKDELNEFAAAAIYANVLSFVNDYPNQWEEVAKYAKLAIEGGSLMSGEQLVSGFNDLGLSDVLWGADINSETNTFYASFMSNIDPFGPGYGGALGNYKMVASDLYDKISDTDIRKKWFGIDIPEKDPHYAFRQYIQCKFMDVASVGTGDTFCSDYIYFRTGEMYFVAAEALYRAGKEAEAKSMLTTIMKTRDSEYATTATGEALLEEIMLQKRIEMWGEGRRLFDMKRRNENLDRTHAVNHSATTPKEVPAGSKLFIYQIPQKELNANAEITEQND